MSNTQHDKRQAKLKQLADDRRRAHEATFGKDYTGPQRRSTIYCTNCHMKVGSTMHPFDETSCQA